MLAGACLAQPSSPDTGAERQVIEPQLQTSPEDSPATCVPGVEQKLSDLVDRVKISHSGGVGWTVDIPNQEKSLVESVLSIRQAIAKCPPLRALNLMSSPKPKAALEELLNGPHIRFAGSAPKSLKLEVTDLGRKEPEPVRAIPSQLEQGPNKLDGLAAKLDSLDALLREPHRDYLSRTFGIIVGALSLVSLLGLVALGWMLYYSNGAISDVLNAQETSLKTQASQTRFVERRVGEIERQRPYEQSSRAGEVNDVLRTNDRRSGEFNSNGQPDRKTSGPETNRLSAEQERDRRYNGLIAMVRASMSSIGAFEEARAKLSIISIDRDPNAVTGTNPGLRQSASDPASSNFWGIKFEQQLLLFPGRHLFAIVSTLADAGGHTATKLFSGLFDIDWKASDLRIDSPAVISSDGHGGFQVQTLGRIGLFRRDA